MIKKILSIILCCCLLFGINAFAENFGEEPKEQQFSEEMQKHGGGNGRERGERPSGNERREPPEGEAPPEMPENMNDEMTPRGDFAPPGEENGDMFRNDKKTETEENSRKADRTDNMRSLNGNGGEENEIVDFLKEYSTPLLSMVLLVAAFVFVVFYKRKIY